MKGHEGLNPLFLQFRHVSWCLMMSGSESHSEGRLRLQELTRTQRTNRDSWRYFIKFSTDPSRGLSWRDEWCGGCEVGGGDDWQCANHPLQSTGPTSHSSLVSAAVLLSDPPPHRCSPVFPSPSAWSFSASHPHQSEDQLFYFLSECLVSEVEFEGMTWSAMVHSMSWANAVLIIVGGCNSKILALWELFLCSPLDLSWILQILAFLKLFLTQF